MPMICCFKKQEDPKSFHSLCQGFVALVVLVGPIPSVLIHKTYSLSSQRAHPNRIIVLDPTQSRQLLEFTTCEPVDVRVHHIRTNRCSSSPLAEQSMLEIATYEPIEAQAEDAQTVTKHPHTFAFKEPELQSVGGTNGWRVERTASQTRT